MAPRATPRNAKARTTKICRRTIPRPRAIVSAADGSSAAIGAGSDESKYAPRFASNIGTSNAELRLCHELDHIFNSFYAVCFPRHALRSSQCGLGRPSDFDAFGSSARALADPNSGIPWGRFLDRYCAYNEDFFCVWAATYGIPGAAPLAGWRACRSFLRLSYRRRAAFGSSAMLDARGFIEGDTMGRPSQRAGRELLGCCIAAALRLLPMRAMQGSVSVKLC